MKKVAAMEDSAVSPIIGTVLLIAITVTLAASLFTVMSGYLTGLPQTSPTASLQVINDTASSHSGINGTYDLTVTYVSNNITTGRINVEVTMSDDSLYSFHLSPVISASGGQYYLFNGTSGNLSVSYSGPGGYLTTSSQLIFKETNSSLYIQRISLIDTTADSSIGSVSMLS